MNDLDLQFNELAELLCQTEYRAVGETFAVPYNPDKETFSRAFFRMLDERMVRSKELANQVDVSRQIISKLRCVETFIPNKRTVCALAYGLQLTLEETQSFLHKAGYHLSNAIPFDKIIMDFIKRDEFDIFKLNQELYSETGSTLLDLRNR